MKYLSEDGRTVIQQIMYWTSIKTSALCYIVLKEIHRKITVLFFRRLISVCKTKTYKHIKIKKMQGIHLVSNKWQK